MAGIESHLESDSDGDTDSNTDTESDSDCDTDSNTDTESGSDGDTDTNTDTNTDTYTTTDTYLHTDTDTDTHTDADTDTDTDLYSACYSDSDSDSDFYFDCESNYERIWSSTKIRKYQQYMNVAIRRGDLDGARSFVENSTPEIKKKIKEDSSLMLAALRNNKPEFIRFLVEECKADLEISVTKSSSSDAYGDSITPLRYAARFKKTEAAVELMRLGANVNAVSPNEGLTALHEACKQGTAVIVRHLIQHGADLTIRDKRGKTALMIGVCHVKENVCRELIACGADVNASDNAGNTALHAAVAIDVLYENTAAAKLLIENGADLFKENDDGLDALCVACTNEAPDTVKFMRAHLSGDDVGHQALIRSHQLLGACYLYYDEKASIFRFADEALVEWEAAVRLCERRRHVITGDADVVSTPNPAYDNAVEVDSMPKFDEMRQDANKIHMQGLLLKEKILGPTHRLTIESVIRLAEFYITSEDYGRGLRLMRHGFKLSHDGKVSCTMRIFYLFQLRRVSVDHRNAFNAHAIKNTVDFKEVYEFLEYVTFQKQRSGQPPMVVTCMDCKENKSFMLITLFLVKLFTLLETNEVNTAQFRRLVREFVRLQLLSSHGRTVLMNAILLIKRNDHALFSFEVDAIKLLLECGADTWETDFRGNTVLHLLAKSKQRIVTANDKNKEANKKLAEMLLAFGAHFDARNNEGFTAVDYLSSLGLEFSVHMTLQCLAAKAIRRHKIPYAGILPSLLADFVQMH